MMTGELSRESSKKLISGCLPSQEEAASCRNNADMNNHCVSEKSGMFEALWNHKHVHVHYHFFFGRSNRRGTGQVVSTSEIEELVRQIWS